MDEDYAPLIAAVAERSVRTYFQGRDQLVVCSQSGPALPFSGNSFWVSLRGAAWYLCTWGPVCYQVPAAADLADLCAEFVARGRDVPYKETEHYLVTRGFLVNPQRMLRDLLSGESPADSDGTGGQ